MTIQVAPDDCTGCGICVDVCPAQQQGGGQAQGHRHGAQGAATSTRSARWFDFFLRHPGSRPRRASARTRSRARSSSSRCSSSRAPARAAARRPTSSCSRQLFGDRMLVANATGCSSIYGGNLPTTPWSVGRGRPRPGLVQLAVRGQRRVRPGHAPGAWTRRRDLARDAARRARADELGDDLVDELLGGDQRAPATADRAQRKRVGGAPGAARRASTSAAARNLAARRRRAGAEERLDRGRRRVGLRHRVRRARPRAGDRPRREHPGARHRGLLEHRRPGVEGHAARRRRQVRGGGQVRRQEGPRDDRHGVRQRLRRADRDGRRHAADGQGARRGRGAPRAVARHRLQPLHRARHRHVDGDGAPEGGGRSRATGRSTATTRRPSRRASTPSISTRKAPTIPLKTFAQKEARFAMLARSDPDRAEALLREAQEDVDDRWHLYEQMAGHRARTVEHADEPIDATEEGERAMSVDLRTRYLGLDLANPIVPSASPMGQRIETLKATGGRGRRGGRPAVAVRGADRARGDADPRARSDVGSESYAEAPTYLPVFEDYNTGPDAYLAPRRGRQGGARHPGDRQPERHHGRAAGLAHAKPDPGGGRRRPGAERVLHRRRAGRDRRGRRGAVRRAGGGGPCRRSRSRSPSRSGRSSAPWGTWPTGSWPPEPTGSCCSTGSCSPTSTSTR